jgi:hypothetical protein
MNRETRITVDRPHPARRRSIALVAVGVALVAAAAAVYAAGSAATGPRFTGDRAETERFLVYNRSIELTPEQEKVRVEALEALPAPCCSQYTAATCCCPCNMALATWGLAKHLIVDQGYGVAEVRAAVAEWHRAINPEGFSGDVCASPGGCGRPFAKNGCGGMDERHLVH